MARRLIVCCDGTWNKPEKTAADKRITNVVKTARAIRPNDHRTGTAQIVYYDEGVGTGDFRIDRVLGGLFGFGLARNVQEAYRFLCLNYDEGDEIFLFGFSRGAYTVRSLAGFVGRVGLLHKGDMHLTGEAFDFYRVPPRDRDAAAFDAAKARFEDILTEGRTYPDRRRRPKITFVGVWDTVGALGIPSGPLLSLTRASRNFHDVALGTTVIHARHALAIDERRKAYAPAVWTGAPAEGQTVKQVWFAGAHSNVGGGYEDSGLSDGAWRWMLDEAKTIGLALDDAYLARRCQPNPLGVLVESHRRGWVGPVVATLSGLAARPRLTQPTEDIHESVEARLAARARDARLPRTAKTYADLMPNPHGRAGPSR